MMDTQGATVVVFFSGCVEAWVDYLGFVYNLGHRESGRATQTNSPVMTERYPQLYSGHTQHGGCAAVRLFKLLVRDARSIFQNGCGSFVLLSASRFLLRAPIYYEFERTRPTASMRQSCLIIALLYARHTLRGTCRVAQCL